MLKYLKANRYFFVPYSVLLLTSILLLVLIPKPDLHILSNKANTHFFDCFFKYLTYLGDGTMIGILFIVLLFFKYRIAFAFLTGSVITSVVVNLFKKVIFHNMYRPSKYFELFESYKLHLVDGVKIHSLQSFPSGHTATAFNLFLTLAILSKKNSLKFLFLCMACLVAYSRVYLSQHFLADITAGSVLGIIFIIAAFLWFDNIKKTWLDKSFVSKYNK